MAKAMLVTYRFGYQPDLTVHLTNKKNLAMEAEDRREVFQLCEAVLHAKNPVSLNQAVERLLVYASDWQRHFHQDQSKQPSTPLIDLLQDCKA